MSVAVLIEESKQPIRVPTLRPPKLQTQLHVEVVAPELVITASVDEPSTATSTPSAASNNVAAPRALPTAPSPEEKAAATNYAAMVSARLGAEKSYPPNARRLREEGVVLLLVTIDRSGRILRWRIGQSSGIDDLDGEVTRMMKAIPLFPPFPTSMTQQLETFSVPVEFSLIRASFDQH